MPCISRYKRVNVPGQIEFIMNRDYKKHDYLINMHGSLVEARNERRYVDERRYAYLLKLTSTGTFVMGIWNVIKVFMGMFSDIGDELLPEGIPVAVSVFGNVIILGFFFFLAISFRYFIWKGAGKEVRDGKERYGYIVCAIILMAYGVFAIASFIRHLVNNDFTGYDITKFIFDLTSMFFLSEMLYSAFKLRKVRIEIAERA